MLDLFLPKFCVCCGVIGAYICTRCSKSVQRIEQNETICPMCDRPGFNGLTHPLCNSKYALKGLVCLYHYSGPIKKLIKQGKYKFAFHSLDWLVKSSLIPKNLENLVFLNEYTIVPIPLHSKKLRERGFNQAEIIAKALAKSLKLAIDTKCLMRTVYTNPQAGVKTKKVREAHMKGVFEACKTKVPQKVLLVDDVFTTGATMKDAARALRSGGVSEVFGFTIAR